MFEDEILLDFESLTDYSKSLEEDTVKMENQTLVPLDGKSNIQLNLEIHDIVTVQSHLYMKIKDKVIEQSAYYKELADYLNTTDEEMIK